MQLTISTPRWAIPLLSPARYKGAWGGRGSGKSHFFAEYLIERMIADPDLKVVCVREIQKSLKFSAKALLEAKIEKLGVGHLFDILLTEIRRKDGRGICIFQGMSDHTADSIKSLEGFSLCWVEEAQNLSARSLALLRPTIRTQGSEILFSWNPENDTDCVDQFLRVDPPENAIVVRANYCDNPFLPDTLYEEMLLDRARDTDYYAHIWLGEYNLKSDLQVLSGRWGIDEFDPGKNWDGPYYGADWGFAQDPTAAIECYIYQKKLYIYRESWAIALELDHTVDRWRRDLPGIDKHIVRADSARPESISYVRRHGITKITGADKWSGSVEDGVAFLRSFDKIIVHPQCPRFLEECRLYSYKQNKAGDILPQIVDKHNHLIDSLRYALAPLIRNQSNRRAAPVAAGYERSPKNLRRIF